MATLDRVQIAKSLETTEALIERELGLAFDEEPAAFAACHNRIVAAMQSDDRERIAALVVDVAPRVVLACLSVFYGRAILEGARRHGAELTTSRGTTIQFAASAATFGGPLGAWWRRFKEKLRGDAPRGE